MTKADQIIRIDDSIRRAHALARQAKAQSKWTIYEEAMALANDLHMQQRIMCKRILGYLPRFNVDGLTLSNLLGAQDKTPKGYPGRMV